MIVVLVNAGAWGLRARRRTVRGMTMRAPLSELPILLDDVSYAVRDVTIIDRVTLALAPGPPTVLIGPNGAGKTTFIRLAMDLIAPSRGRVTWGGREVWQPPIAPSCSSGR